MWEIVRFWGVVVVGKGKEGKDGGEKGLEFEGGGDDYD